MGLHPSRAPQCVLQGAAPPSVICHSLAQMLNEDDQPNAISTKLLGSPSGKPVQETLRESSASVEGSAGIQFLRERERDKA